MFSEKFKALRELKGVKQCDVAKALGVSQATVNRYEQGVKEPGREVLVRIADYFDVSLDFLLGRSSPQSGRAPGEYVVIRKADAGVLENMGIECYAINERLKEYLSDEELNVLALQFLKSKIQQFQEEKEGREASQGHKESHDPLV